ncbi:hypothetical protein MLD38_016018 [Melastoma candidum]|uniref:Uncharacterized protein n=1 Tax=Melastoma candidum TaxID=119954 RepID=A0ACB9RHT6_9MYRT|nr:hypothetical protein MLD38_016018 [Melastoma candidum]
MDISRWRSHLTFRTLYVLLLGQLISFLYALASFTSSFIATLGLALIYGTIMVFRRRGMQVPWYWYLLLGFVDVQGNYFINKAYQYTSITSVSMLQCWTIVWAIVLTFMFIGTRYSLWQLLGAALSVVGLGIVMLSDADVGGGDSPRPVLGDSLVIVGTVFTATSNVSEEFCVKKKDRVEMLTMLGTFGFLFSVVEISIFERDDIASIKWSTELVLALVGFVLSCIAIYSLTPFLLKMSGAAMFNLSAITAGLWSVVFRIFIYDQQVDWLYYFAFGVIIAGIVIYSTSGKDMTHPSTVGNGNVDQYHELPSGNDTQPRTMDRVTSEE